ncbi:DMT family transporter [Xinfangfangia pollutisoli]|uniref:DMT family transporter n=1 Tax=Xinfangfangia pollutisoli TaxID=2865960 RepID=UPI001CD61A2E|nr:DMT family transporter [Xinfangfangia pollutisoli]
MTTAAAQIAGENARATLWMVGAMAGFAVEDLFLKQAAGVVPPGLVLLINGGIGGLIFWIIAQSRGEKVFSLEAFRGAALVRNLSECFAAFFYIVALALAPLAMASALLQASPLIVTMGAALVLGETVGWRRWLAVGLGFVGVLVILAPWRSGFDLAGLSMVVCVIALAARDLATRRMKASLGTFSVSAWGYLASVPAGLLLLAVRGEAPVMPPPGTALNLGGALLFGLIAYYAIVHAMRIGEVSAIAPFRYTRLVFAVILAVLVLGERPEAHVLIGSAIVVLSGLYAFARERKRKAALSLQAKGG